MSEKLIINRQVMDQKLKVLKQRLFDHEIYTWLDHEDKLKYFMSFHVFCVWDFQSLLKFLQQHLTTVSVPWLPSPRPELRRLINEIVLEEESDEVEGYGYLSHFEWYVEAMSQAGAPQEAIFNLIDELKKGVELQEVLARPFIAPAIKKFVGNTFSLMNQDRIHVSMAAFTYGREDIIPEMFKKLVGKLAKDQPEQWALFAGYLARHIECDGDKHGPMAHRLLEELCQDDPIKWQEAFLAASSALEARIQFWDFILATKGQSTQLVSAVG